MMRTTGGVVGLLAMTMVAISCVNGEGAGGDSTGVGSTGTTSGSTGSPTVVDQGNGGNKPASGGSGNTSGSTDPAPPTSTEASLV